MHTLPPRFSAAASHPALSAGALPASNDDTTTATNSGVPLLLIEDHQSMIDGMLPRLQQDYQVTVVNTYDAMQKAIAQTKFTLAIVDLSLPGHLHGMRMMPILREAGIKFLIFSGTAEEWQIRASIRMSARGFVDKRQGLAVLVQALRKIEAGSFSFPDDLMDRLEAAEGKPLPKRFGPGEVAVMNQMFALAE
ncbi:MAG: response regulator transcription factor, partial [Burkholderiales bacterium]|nr:response regulator transcription factor [Burkholderiales bacterium]